MGRDLFEVFMESGWKPYTNEYIITVVRRGEDLLVIGSYNIYKVSPSHDALEFTIQMISVV
jgi:hypothetical protein